MAGSALPSLPATTPSEKREQEIATKAINIGVPTTFALRYAKIYVQVEQLISDQQRRRRKLRREEEVRSRVRDAVAKVADQVAKTKAAIGSLRIALAELPADFRASRIKIVDCLSALVDAIGTINEEQVTGSLRPQLVPRYGKKRLILYFWLAEMRDDLHQQEHIETQIDPANACPSLLDARPDKPESEA